MVVLTGCLGTNAELISNVADMYLKEGQRVLDVTYGRGVFWKNVNTSLYEFVPSDLQDGVDFTNLPYDDRSADVLVLDPPYMHGGATVKSSINDCYKNQNTSHESVIRLYAGGILEAARVLKKNGLIWVKCQDEIESGKQRPSYREICMLLEAFGFEIVDTFVLVQNTIPAMREKYQKTARKNHSYLVVGRFRR